MSEPEVKSPPTESDLPQGAKEFLECHRLMFEAANALFAPYLGRHQGISGNYAKVIEKLREAGMWANDALNMAMHPEMFAEPKPADEQEIPDGDES